VKGSPDEDGGQRQTAMLALTSQSALIPHGLEKHGFASEKEYSLLGRTCVSKNGSQIFLYCTTNFCFVCSNSKNRSLDQPKGK